MTYTVIFELSDNYLRDYYNENMHFELAQNYLNKLANSLQN